MKISFNVLAHVVAPARMDHRVVSNVAKATWNASKVRLRKAHYVGLLNQLYDWITVLEPLDLAKSNWEDYDRTNTYQEAERATKRAFVRRLCKRTRPDLLVDIGCNTGEYSEVALASGAKRAIGFDLDSSALQKACRRAIAKNLALTPLSQDALNPSPGQGWKGLERKPIQERAKFDTVLALAVLHHLVIARNVPLDDAVGWIVDWAPSGVIEFVPKTDPMVQTMLALREDIFGSYTREAFETSLCRRARIFEHEEMSSSHRILYAFNRI